MSDPVTTQPTFWNNDFFMMVVFPIASFVISIGVAISFWVSDKVKDNNHQKNITKIINENVKQLTTICNRLYVDVDELEGTTGQDVEKAQRLSMYFDRNITRLEMLRLNIENQLVLLKGSEEYVKRIKKILEHEDWIIEKCNRPDMPERYRLSIWRENRSDLQEKTHDVITIARDLKIINNH